jgi:hypothetical protein
MDQATYVTVRHLFSRPFGTSLQDWSVPRISSWAIFSRPFGTGLALVFGKVQSFSKLQGDIYAKK